MPYPSRKLSHCGTVVHMQCCKGNVLSQWETPEFGYPLLPSTKAIIINILTQAGQLCLLPFRVNGQWCPWRSEQLSGTIACAASKLRIKLIKGVVLFHNKHIYRNRYKEHCMCQVEKLIKFWRQCDKKLVAIFTQLATSIVLHTGM